MSGGTAVALNRVAVGPDTGSAASLDVLPTLWFRNTWSWEGGGSKPILQRVAHKNASVISVHLTDPLFQELLADYFLYAEGDVPLLFTENETNNERLFGAPNASPYVKDGINNAVVNRQPAAVNPANAEITAAAIRCFAIWPPPKSLLFCGCDHMPVSPAGK